MYKGVITSATSVTANNNIPFTTVLNTNVNTTANTTENTVQINKSGYYGINAVITLTNVAEGNITATLLADGTALANATVSATSGATTDLIPLPIYDVVKIVPTNLQEKVAFSIQLSANATVNSGTLTIEQIR